MSDIYIRWGAVDLVDDDGRPYKEPAMGVT